MKSANTMLTVLPRAICFADGTRADLISLIRHHYRPGLPATSCRIRIAKTRDDHSRRWRVIGVAVLSWPVPMLPARNRHFGIAGYGYCIRFANQNIRTVSRVIVHPQFRAAGIAQELVRQLVRQCPTRYVESSSSMGAFAGFLLRCGFEPLEAGRGEPAYFLLDRDRIDSNEKDESNVLTDLFQESSDDHQENPGASGRVPQALRYDTSVNG